MKKLKQELTFVGHFAVIILGLWAVMFLGWLLIGWLYGLR